MNPFDLTGPQFLVFYILLGVAVAIATGLAIWLTDSTQPGGRPLTNPYLIACLRGGVEELIRVATLWLVDRGMLRDSSGHRVQANTGANQMASGKLEAAILLRCSSATEAIKLLADAGVRAACQPYEDELRRLKLIPWPKLQWQQVLIGMAGAGVTLAVGLTKLCVALSRGRHNVVFLIVLMVLLPAITLAAARRRRTTAGDAMLKQLKDTYSPLGSRSPKLKSGGEMDTVLMTAALFGLAALPVSEFPYVRELFPRATSGGDGGSGCGGSGCGGSSCGGGGCGGGGCGGGCGGCGG